MSSYSNTLPRRVLTRREAADTLGCSTETIDRLRRTGRIPSITLAGRSIRIPIWAIDDLVKCSEEIPPLGNPGPAAAQEGGAVHD